MLEDFAGFDIAIAVASSGLTLAALAAISLRKAAVAARNRSRRSR